MKNTRTVFLLLVLILLGGCSDSNFSHYINPDEISWGTLKIHKDGTLVNDIELMNSQDLLKEAIEAYNNAKLLTVEDEEDAHEVNFDPISTDGPLKEEFSASYFTIDVQSADTHYYIGYKGNNIFKVIASGGRYKKQPKEYLIESKALKKIILVNE